MANSNTTSGTTKKQQKPHLIGKGFDGHPEHINRKGRPPTPHTEKELQNLLDEIFAEQVEDERGRKVEKLRVMLNRMMISKNAASQIHLLDRRFGKIPDVIKGEGEQGEIPVRIVEVIKTYEKE